MGWLLNCQSNRSAPYFYIAITGRCSLLFLDNDGGGDQSSDTKYRSSHLRIRRRENPSPVTLGNIKSLISARGI